MVAEVTMYTVRAERRDDWWLLTVPAAPGAFSQVRRLSEAEEHAREAISFVLDVAPDSFDVDVVPHLPDDRLGSEIAVAREATREAERAQRLAAAQSRTVVQKLKQRGLTGADIAAVLDISPQRVSQLSKPPSASSRRRRPTGNPAASAGPAREPRTG
jgi:DNA-directed RNA polymerase specialized sigma24 family protein